MSTSPNAMISEQEKADRLRRAIVARSQGKLTAEQGEALNQILGAPENRAVVRMALAEPEKAGFSVFGGLISPEDITQAMFGMSGEQLKSLRDAQDVPGETPAAAGLRTFFAGAGGSAAEEASAFTSPVAIATGAIGKVAKGTGAVARGARGLLTLGGAAGGVQGGSEIAGGLEEGVTTPEGSERMLRGLSSAVSTAPIMSRPAQQLRKLSLERGRTPGQQAAGLSAAVDVDPAVAKKALPVLRKSAKQLGYKAKDFKGAEGVERFGEVLDNGMKMLEQPVKQVLQQHGAHKVDGNKIADAVEARISKTMQKLRPEEVKNIKDELQRYRQDLTLEDLNVERTALNADLNAFYKKGDLAQSADVKKTNALKFVAKKARDTIAEELYNNLDTLSGKRAGTFHQIKTQESKLLEIKEQYVKVAKKVRKADARHEALGFVGRVREAVPTGIAFESARVPVGRALLAERPSATEGRFLRTAFSGAPTTPPKASQLSRAAIIGLLNALTDDEER